jgi:hypothetical protein
MTALDLPNYNALPPMHPNTCQSSNDQARAIKRAMSAYRKIVRNDLPPTAWGTTIRIAKLTQAGAQDLTGCGCGCS